MRSLLAAKWFEVLRTGFGEIRRALFGYDVFLSYANEDVAFATAVHRALVAARMRVFFDISESETGLPLVRLLNAASRSRMVLVVLTPNTAASSWVAQEIDAHLRSPGIGRVCAVFADGALIRKAPSHLVALRDRAGIYVSAGKMAAAAVPPDFAVRTLRAFRGGRQLLIWTAILVALACASLAWLVYERSDANQVRLLRNLVAQDRSVLSCSQDSGRYLSALVVAGFEQEATDLALGMRDPSQIANCAAPAQSEVAIALLLRGKEAMADSILAAALLSDERAPGYLRANSELAWALGRRGHVRDLQKLHTRQAVGVAGLATGFALAGRTEEALGEINATRLATQSPEQVISNTAAALVFFGKNAEALDLMSRVDEPFSSVGLEYLIKAWNSYIPPPQYFSALATLSNRQRSVFDRLNILEQTAGRQPADEVRRTTLQLSSELRAMRERETDAAAKAAAVAKSELLSKDSTVRELETPMWQTLVEQTAPEFDTNYLQLIRAAEAIHDEGLVSNLAGELRSPENRLSQTLCPSHVSDSERCPKIDASDAVAAATLLLGCGRLRCASQILQSIPQENNPEYRGLTPLFAHAGLIPQAKESFSQALAYARFRHDDDAHRDTPDLAGIPIGVADQGQFDAAIEMAMALPETGPRAIALTGILGSALDQGAVESLPRIMEAASADNNASEGSAYFIYRAQAFARLGQFRNARQDVFALPDRAQRLRAVAAIMEERAKQLQPELARRFHAERVLMAPKQEPRQLTNRLYAR